LVSDALRLSPKYSVEEIARMAFRYNLATLGMLTLEGSMTEDDWWPEALEHYT
jgi:hypothetical protein